MSSKFIDEPESKPVDVEEGNNESEELESVLVEPLKKPFCHSVCFYTGYSLILLACLFFFICSLDLLSTGFRLIGGKLVGEIIRQNNILTNPLAGLMIGMLMTVLLQSSSTTTSIIITLIATRIIRVTEATFMIMGANIGTSVTNTMVAFGQIVSRTEFKLAFAGATVHDMFNWLTVLVLLPLELMTGYLNLLSGYIVSKLDLRALKIKKVNLLKTITSPVTKLILPLNKKILTSPDKLENASTIIKVCCDKTSPSVFSTNSSTNSSVTTGCHKKCNFLFKEVAGRWSDQTLGILITLMSLVFLTLCLVVLVRVLKKLFLSRFMHRLQKSSRPPTESCCNWYDLLAIPLGCGMTILIQSSSVFTSALTPLVATQIISLERMFALTIGSNVGTTVTGILSALAQSYDSIEPALQTALIHLFFNLSGILIWYPIPQVRKVPLALASKLGATSYHYRWFAVLYIAIFFIMLPLVVFSLSLFSWIVPTVFVSLCLTLLLFVVVLNLLQKKYSNCLPQCLRTWHFLPLYLRSLEPYDRIIMKLICCKSCKKDMIPIKKDGVLAEQLPMNIVQTAN